MERAESAAGAPALFAGSAEDSGRELVLARNGVCVRIVDDADAGFCVELSNYLPPSLPQEKSGVETVCYVIRCSDTATLTLPEYEVLRDGDSLFRSALPSEVTQWVCGNVDGVIARRSREGLFVHAGVVGWRGRAILVAGRSMTGKSTLVAELVRRGATYYSDEFAVLDDDGLVHPYARSPMLRAAADGVRHLLRMESPPGQTPLPISLVVSAPFQKGACWNPAKITGVRAVLPIIDNTILAKSEPERTLRIAARLGKGVVTLEGMRPDAEIVAPHLLDLVDGLLDTPSLAEERDLRATRLLGRASLLRAKSGFPPTDVTRAKCMVIEDVLEPGEHAQLLAYAQTQEAEFEASAVMGDNDTANLDPVVRRSGTVFDVSEVLRPLEHRLRRLLPHVRREMGLAWFPLAKAEVQLVVHEEDGFFAAHTDNGRPSVAGRALTCIYYMHASPRRFSGGELILHDTAALDGGLVSAGARLSVRPADNTAVFFASDLLHEVRPVHRATDAFADSRFSVNVWFWSGQWPGRSDSTGATRSGESQVPGRTAIDLRP